MQRTGETEAEPGGVMISRQRLDSLSDGVFAFAMTLLVVNLQFSAGTAITSADDLLQAIHDLQNTFVAYVISFFVLAIRWISGARAGNDKARASTKYAWSVILHLFFVTLIPFSTMLVGNYGDLWPAICIYAANTALAALSAYYSSIILERESHSGAIPGDRAGLLVLIISALVSAAMSFVAPDLALLAYLFNLGAPALQRARPRS